MRRYAIALLVVMTAAASAQQARRLRGIVTDSAKLPLADVEISVLVPEEIARTKGDGSFVLYLPVNVPIEVVVRRLGYVQQTLSIAAGGDLDSLIFRLVPSLDELAAVSVVADRQRSWYSEFNRRKAHGLGTFFTRDQILARNSFRPSELLRSVPGLRIVNGGIRMTYTTHLAPGQNCAPMLWIDGQRAPGMEIDVIPLTDVEGIEVYHGPATTPGQFATNMSSFNCGTIVMWTRPGNTRSK